MEFCFEDCLELAATNPDYCFDDADIPLLKEAFARWIVLLQFKNVAHKEESYTLVFLPDQVEQEIVEKMFEKPSLAWALASLAYIMLRIRAKELLMAEGCLPFPKINQGLASELEKIGHYANGKISPRFSLFTYDLPGAGCADCALLEECPQRN